MPEILAPIQQPFDKQDPNEDFLDIEIPERQPQTDEKLTLQESELKQQNFDNASRINEDLRTKNQSETRYFETAENLVEKSDDIPSDHIKNLRDIKDKKFSEKRLRETLNESLNLSTLPPLEDLSVPEPQLLQNFQTLPEMQNESLQEKPKPSSRVSKITTKLPGYMKQTDASKHQDNSKLRKEIDKKDRSRTERLISAETARRSQNNVQIQNSVIETSQVEIGEDSATKNMSVRERQAYLQKQQDNLEKEKTKKKSQTVQLKSVNQILNNAATEMNLGYFIDFPTFQNFLEKLSFLSDLSKKEDNPERINAQKVRDAIWTFANPYGTDEVPKKNLTSILATMMAFTGKVSDKEMTDKLGEKLVDFYQNDGIQLKAEDQSVNQDINKYSNIEAIEEENDTKARLIFQEFQRQGRIDIRDFAGLNDVQIVNKFLHQHENAMKLKPFVVAFKKEHLTRYVQMSLTRVKQIEVNNITSKPGTAQDIIPQGGKKIREHILKDIQQQYTFAPNILRKSTKMANVAQSKILKEIEGQKQQEDVISPQHESFERKGYLENDIGFSDIQSDMDNKRNEVDPNTSIEGLSRIAESRIRSRLEIYEYQQDKRNLKVLNKQIQQKNKEIDEMEKMGKPKTNNNKKVNSKFVARFNSNTALDTEPKPLSRKMQFVQEQIAKKKAEEEAQMTFKPQKFSNYKPKNGANLSPPKTQRSNKPTQKGSVQTTPAFKKLESNNQLDGKRRIRFMSPPTNKGAKSAFDSLVRNLEQKIKNEGVLPFKNETLRSVSVPSLNLKKVGQSAPLKKTSKALPKISEVKSKYLTEVKSRYLTQNTPSKKEAKQPETSVEMCPKQSGKGLLDALIMYQGNKAEIYTVKSGECLECQSEAIAKKLKLNNADLEIVKIGINTLIDQQQKDGNKVKSPPRGGKKDQKPTKVNCEKHSKKMNSISLKTSPSFKKDQKGKKTVFQIQTEPQNVAANKKTIRKQSPKKIDVEMKVEVEMKVPLTTRESRIPRISERLRSALTHRVNQGAPSQISRSSMNHSQGVNTRDTIFNTKEEKMQMLINQLKQVPQHRNSEIITANSFQYRATTLSVAVKKRTTIANNKDVFSPLMITDKKALVLDTDDRKDKHNRQRSQVVNTDIEQRRFSQKNTPQMERVYIASFSDVESLKLAEEEKKESDKKPVKKEEQKNPVKKEEQKILTQTKAKTRLEKSRSQKTSEFGSTVKTEKAKESQIKHEVIEEEKELAYVPQPSVDYKDHMKEAQSMILSFDQSSNGSTNIFELLEKQVNTAEITKEKITQKEIQENPVKEKEENPERPTSSLTLPAQEQVEVKPVQERKFKSLFTPQSVEEVEKERKIRQKEKEERLEKERIENEEESKREVQRKIDELHEENARKREEVARIAAELKKKLIQKMMEKPGAWNRKSMIKNQEPKDPSTMYKDIKEGGWKA